jgi:hypothetical protein
MAFIDIKRDPSRRELVLFAIVLLLFGVVLGVLTLAGPGILKFIAVAAGAAWLVSTVWNRDEPRKTQLLGLICPLVCGTGYAAIQGGTAPIYVAGVFWAAAVAAAVGALVNHEFGRRLYVGWATAFLPLGWTVSQLLLAVVYYVVMTPIGLAMRIIGRDPLHRTFDRSAKTYWVESKPPIDSKRYFQQF